MTQIKQYPVEIVPCPILRESSGLAMSSRNQRLTEQGKNKAALLYQILKMVCIEKEGSKMEEIRQRASKLLKEQNIELDYLVLAEEEKLGPQESIQHKNQLRVFIAATIEGIRLIDNMPLD
jgi:pantoate--beta-alanine ligase